MNPIPVLQHKYSHNVYHCIWYISVWNGILGLYDAFLGKQNISLSFEEFASAQMDQ